MVLKLSTESLTKDLVSDGVTILGDCSSLSSGMKVSSGRSFLASHRFMTWLLGGRGRYEFRRLNYAREHDKATEARQGTAILRCHSEVPQNAQHIRKTRSNFIGRPST